MSTRLLFIVLLGVVAAGLVSSTPSAATSPNTISLTNKMWTCSGPVDLDSVSVTMNPDAVVTRFTRDAVHLQPGCTGRIGKLTIVTSIADGLKIAGGVHDLTIGGGSIRCLAKLPTLHQDGVQVLGGERVTMTGLSIDCGRADDSLINSNLFINMAGVATTPSRTMRSSRVLIRLRPVSARRRRRDDQGAARSSVCLRRSWPATRSTRGSTR